MAEFQTKIHDPAVFQPKEEERERVRERGECEHMMETQRERKIEGAQW